MSFEKESREEDLRQRKLEQGATRYFSSNTLPTPVPATGVAPLSGHTNSVSRVVALDDGALLATACYDGRVRVYNSTGGASVPRHDLSGHEGLVLSLAPLGGAVLVSGGWSNQLVSWNARTGARLDVLRLSDKSVPSIAPVDDGCFVAGTGSGDLVFFEHSKGHGLREVDRIRGAHASWINHIAVRGDLMVTASFDKSAVLWHVPSRTRIATLPHISNVWCAALSDRFLATGSLGEMRVYEIERNCALKLVLKGVHADEFVHAVALAGDDWLLSAGGDGAVTFTSLASEQPVVRVSTSVPYVLDIALLPNGRVAVCGNETNDCYSKVFPSPIGVDSLLREYTATLFPNHVPTIAAPTKAAAKRSKSKSKSKKNKKKSGRRSTPTSPQLIPKAQPLAGEQISITEKALPEAIVQNKTTTPPVEEPIEQSPSAQRQEPEEVASSETKVMKDENDFGSLMQQWAKHDTPPKPKQVKLQASPKRTETPARETLKKITAEEDVDSPTSVGALIQQWANRQ